MTVPVGFDPFAVDEVTFHTTGGVLSTTDPVGLIFMFEGELVPPSEVLAVVAGKVSVAVLPDASVMVAPPVTSDVVAT